MSERDTVVALSLRPQQVSNCCSTTADGNSVCLVPQNGQAASCSSPLPEVPTQKRSEPEAPASQAGLWQNVRSGLMFGVACLTSPCCTPLFVPVVIALFAGTPVALWMNLHLGWVYGALTLMSIISFVLVIRGVSARTPTAHAPIYPADIPVLPVMEGNNARAD